MKNPSGTKRGRLIIQGSTLSFKGCIHQEESAWKANQCWLMIWVNCFEDGRTSVLICRPLQSPSVRGFVFQGALPLLRNSDLPLSLWVIQSSFDGNLFTLCSACQIADIVVGREVIYLSGAMQLFAIFPSTAISLLKCPTAWYLLDINSWVHTCIVMLCIAPLLSMCVKTCWKCWYVRITFIR